MSASAQRITLSADTRAEVMVTAGDEMRWDEMRWDEMVEQVSRLSWSSWRIFVSSLTLSSHCSIAPLLYRTILSFIITQMSIIGPPLSCKKQMSEQQRLWPGQKSFFFWRRAEFMAQCITFCVSVPPSLFLFSAWAHIETLTDSHTLSHSEDSRLANVSIWLKKQFR